MQGGKYWNSIYIRITQLLAAFAYFSTNEAPDIEAVELFHKSVLEFLIKFAVINCTVKDTHRVIASPSELGL